MTDVRTTLRRRLRAAIAREARSLVTLAEVSGVSAPTLSRLLREDGRLPNVETVWALARGLRVDPHWLLGSNLHEAPEPPSRSEPVRTTPKRLPPQAWSLIRAQRARGVSWPRIAALLEDRMQLRVGVNAIRRAWEVRASLRAGV